LPNTIFWYEAFSAYQLLLGDQNTLAAAPSLSPDKIPLSEGADLLFNRGMGLIFAWFGLSVSTTSKSPLGLPEVDLEIAKAYLAMGDCLLLLGGKYDVSYAVRLGQARHLLSREVSRLPLDLQSIAIEVLPAYIAALTERLSPEITPRSPSPMSDAWNDAMSLYERFVRSYESHRLGVPVDTWMAYAECIVRFSSMSPSNALRSALRLGARSVLSPHCCRHPHQRVMAAWPTAAFEAIQRGVHLRQTSEFEDLLGSRFLPRNLDAWQLASFLLKAWHPH
jgi:hypothetical protein